MIIHCQKCDKKFEILDSLIPDKGRLVECGFCKHQWNQSKEKIEDLYSSKEETNEQLQDDELSVRTTVKDETIENDVSIDVQNIDTSIEDESSANEQVKRKLVDKNLKNKKIINNKKVGFFSYLIIFLITSTAFIILLDTFQYQLSSIFPQLEIYLGYIYETLNNILILINDLFKSY